MDLQICQFTASLLVDLESKNDKTLARVEFRSNGTYDILPERQPKKRSKQKVVASTVAKPTSGNAQVVDADVIEIL